VLSCVKVVLLPRLLFLSRLYLFLLFFKNKIFNSSIIGLEDSYIKQHQQIGPFTTNGAANIWATVERCLQYPYGTQTTSSTITVFVGLE